MRCGSSPNQSGFWAVLSKIDEVLNGSNPPREAASAVFANSALKMIFWLGGKAPTPLLTLIRTRYLIKPTEIKNYGMLQNAEASRSL